MSQSRPPATDTSDGLTRPLPFRRPALPVLEPVAWFAAQQRPGRFGLRVRPRCRHSRRAQFGACGRGRLLYVVCGSWGWRHCGRSPDGPERRERTLRARSASFRCDRSGQDSPGATRCRRRVRRCAPRLFAISSTFPNAPSVRGLGKKLQVDRLDAYVDGTRSVPVPTRTHIAS